jgi:peroxiredoxin Q/BCP
VHEYAAKNAVILGASFDTREENERFAAKFDFPFPLLCDTDRSIGLAYGAATSKKDVYAKRIAYVIDENGLIAQAHPKVVPSEYPKEQLASL